MDTEEHTNTEIKKNGSKKKNKKRLKSCYLLDNPAMLTNNTNYISTVNIGT